MGKKLSLLYFSATDTTAKIVKEIGKGISAHADVYDLTLPANRQKSLTFSSDDLVIVGVPVYSGRVPDFLVDYFEKIKGNNTLAVFIAVYGNRGYNDALLELKDTFENNGFIGIAGGVFIGEHSYTAKVATGRPDTEDLNIALQFGTAIKTNLDNITEYSQINKLHVNGNYPYKERMKWLPVPVTDDKCIKCGKCAKHCPMAAIDFVNFIDVDSTTCIKCCSCIKRCPVGAKTLNEEKFDKAVQTIIDTCSNVRKEPELFI